MKLPETKVMPYNAKNTLEIAASVTTWSKYVDSARRNESNLTLSLMNWEYREVRFEGRMGGVQVTLRQRKVDDFPFIDPHQVKSEYYTLEIAKDSKEIFTTTLHQGKMKRLFNNVSKQPRKNRMRLAA